MQRAVEDEREACAKVCDKIAIDSLQTALQRVREERDKCKRIAWDWGQGATDAETAIRQLHKLFPIDVPTVEEGK